MPERNVPTPADQGVSRMDAREFELAQARCTVGGWARSRKPKAAQIEAAERRWVERCYAIRPPHDEDWAYQCGGCSFFAALGSDFGICWNESGPLDGSVTFEHGGCAGHSELKDTHQVVPDIAQAMLDAHEHEGLG